MAHTKNNPDIDKFLSKADPQLGRVIAAVIPRLGRLRITPSKGSPFEALVRAIIYQQMAYKAAAAIYARLRELTGNVLSPKRVLTLKSADFRSAGLSKSKATYVANLARWFNTNPKTASALPSMPNERIVDTLTAIAGIGVWTVNVFLIFSLGKQDVMPAADLGIRKGLQLAYRLQSPPTPAFVNKTADRWKPYRSIASMYLWQAVKLKLTEQDLHT